MTEQTGEKLYFVYLKAVIRGVLLSAALLLVSALVFYFTSLDEAYMGAVVWVATTLGICYAGIYGGYRAGSNGLLHGLVPGVVYIAVLAAVGLLSETGEINWVSYGIMLVMGVLIGGMSGVIGTNINKIHSES